MRDPFSRPRETLDWAESAINELEAELRRFFQAQPYGYVTDFDSKPGYQIIKLRLMRELPPVAGRKTTEALNNIRHAYDQIVYAACAALGRTPRKDAPFPWGTNPSDVHSRLEKRGVVPPELWDTIKGEEPYPRGEGYAGGNDGIRNLAKIANSKHTIGIRATTKIMGMMLPDISGGAGVSGDIRMGMNWDAVNNEMIVATVPSGAHVQNNYQIASDVIFDETTPLQGVPVLLALKGFLASGQRLLHLLESKCAEINRAH